MKKFPKPWHRPARGVWYVTLYGRQHNLGPNRDAAFKRYSELLAHPPKEQPEDPKKSPAAPPTLLVGLIQRFTADLRANAASGTVEWYRYRLQLFVERVTTLKHYGTGKEFCYRLDGKDKKVGLGLGEDTGADWIVTRIAGRGDSETVTIQAAEGKLKGWYLDCTEDEEKLPVGKTTYTVRRLILVERPQRIKTFSRYVVAP